MNVILDYKGVEMPFLSPYKRDEISAAFAENQLQIDSIQNFKAYKYFLERATYTLVAATKITENLAL